MDTKFTTIEITQKGKVATVWLNRPDIRNAFNETMISELIQAYEELNNNDDIRIIVLKGKGKSFCAGADLNWMKNVKDYTYKQNFDESYQLSKCFYSIYSSKKVTIAQVHGAAIGGANGLLAACDFAYAEEKTVFSLSEVKIGVIPACISPYVVKRVGEFPAKELMLTGKRITGNEAEKFYLINKSLNENELEEYVNNAIKLILSAGPDAVSRCKELIFNVANVWPLETAMTDTAKMIAETRMSEEAQEGMCAFLEKRKPKWFNE